MTNIKQNTVDLTVNCYETARDFNFRLQARTAADFEKAVEIAYQECSEGSPYVDKDVILLSDREQWERLKYAVDLCFEKSI